MGFICTSIVPNKRRLENPPTKGKGGETNVMRHLRTGSKGCRSWGQEPLTEKKKGLGVGQACR